MNELTSALLEIASARLQNLSQSVVFVGGATLGCLIDDSGAAPIRATEDVDVIAEIMTPMEYFDFAEQLRNYGFVEDTREDAPVCRWLHGKLVLDVMPLDKSVLGFSNRWYPDALKYAQNIILPSTTTIKVITAPYFLGTKVEAFRNRGQSDFYSSRDLEDFVAVIDGRDAVTDELVQVSNELKTYLARATRELLTEPRFLDALPGYLLPDEISQMRYGALRQKLGIISRLST